MANLSLPISIQPGILLKPKLFMPQIRGAPIAPPNRAFKIVDNDQF